VLAACASIGTDYVDLCGEPAWMGQMIHKYSSTAEQSGARIVFSCGFDSIPFDLGVYFLQTHAISTTGMPCERVRGRVRAMKGTWSGGTLASLRATMAAVGSDKALLATLLNPFALSPGFTGPSQPPGHKPLYDDELKSWCAPFVMASINTKNIHRSNLLLYHMYGAGFLYDEMVLTGEGEKGESRAKKLHQSKAMDEDKSQPGDGPTREEREAGFYDVLFHGTATNGQSIRVGVKGDMDPGYGSTSKMIVESAVCLLKVPRNKIRGGIHTPASSMGSHLIKRLQENAGLSFEVE
jgi:short subunit dehydrogenase-like uncharacterized protein